MIFEELDEFRKDLKSLSKKFRSIYDDLEVIKLVLSVIPSERPPFSFRVDNSGVDACIIKVKKIACRSLKGRGVNSGLRLIYFLDESGKKIVFIEIFYKGDKENEDRQRILKNFR